MKRALLIAGGTVGSLGAVLSITPPTFTSSESATGIGGGTFAPSTETGNTATPAATAASTPAPSASNSNAATKNPTPTTKPTPTKSASVTGNQNTTPTPAATKSATPTPTKSATPTPTAAANNGKATSGTFTGDPSTMRYGTVQVKITISGGKIVDAVAVQAPSGRDQRYTDMAVPVMRQKTIAAQSANISGVSGASYTSYAWWVSLQSALSKAGWM